MSTDRTNGKLLRRILRVAATIGVIAVLLGGAGAVSYWIKASEPKAQREAATRKSAALVETITVNRGTYRPTLGVLGVVQPARDILLSPRVSGTIIAVEDAFVPGGRIQAGELLLRIDPADFEQAIIMRQSEMRQVEAELRIEEGQQRVARREFELLGEEIDESNRSLVLREPQIEALRARLRAAEASLEQAQLDLERTKVVAPFDGQILDRSVELGSQVSMGDELARLVGTDEYWVMATVPLNTIRQLEFPGAGEVGSSATIAHRTAWGEGVSRGGTVIRLIGEVDDATRLARVIISVPEPLGGEGKPALILGAVVSVSIEARPLDHVVRLDRAYLRQNDTVWINDEGVLRIQSVMVAFSDADHAYIRDGLEDGEQVVTTSLATVANGLEIRELEGETPTTAGGGDGGAP